MVGGWDPKELINRKYGRDVWARILELAQFEETIDIQSYYKDEDTLRLVGCMANVIGVPVEEVWEAYGGFLIQFTMETGWDELLRAMAPDLEGFLDSLDALHYFIDHIVYRTKLKGPSFRCERAQVNRLIDRNNVFGLYIQDGTLVLHYYSKRTGLYPIVKGVVREVSRRIYDLEVVMKVLERKQEHLDTYLTEHVVFAIDGIYGMTEQRSAAVPCHPSAFELPASDFCSSFPYHFCFDRQLVLQHYGAYIRKAYPSCKAGETKVHDILQLVHPEVPLSWESIATYRNSLFVFKLRTEHDLLRAESSSAPVVPLLLKGSMTTVGDEGNYVLYMGSANVTSVREMVERRLCISEMPLHDSMRDLVMLNQSRLSQVELNKRLEETTRSLKRMADELESEKRRTDDVLCELMPSCVADALRNGGTVEAAEFDTSTLLFTDIVTFTQICSQCTPYDVVALLNDLYLRFDRLVGLHGVYKVETIGDAYMIVGGVPEPTVNHTERVLNVALGMLMEARSVLSPVTARALRVRIGVHSGPVVAGVIGVQQPRYCLFGDSVTVANRMESTGKPCRIHVSNSAKDLALATNPSFVFTLRGLTELRAGHAPVLTHFLERNDRISVWEICDRTRSADDTIDGYAELHDYEETSDTAASQHVASIPASTPSASIRSAVEAKWKAARRTTRNIQHDAADFMSDGCPSGVCALS